MATLLRVVDRLVVLDHGEKIAEGDAARGRREPPGDRGVPRRAGGARLMLELARRHRRLRRLHGALGREPLRGQRRGGGRGRAQRRGQDHPAARHLRA